jgi:ATP synthase protein I
MKDPFGPYGKNEADKKATRREMLKALSMISHVAVMVAACLLIGVFLGRFLDNFLGTEPWLLIIFSLLGLGSAFKVLIDLGK